jgi:hypothetical protein
MKTYQVVVEETLVRTSICTVLGDSESEARANAINGMVESEDIHPLFKEVSRRTIRHIEAEEAMGDEHPENG